MAPSHPGFLRASHEDQTSHEDPCLRLLISHSARTEDDQRASPAGRHLALLHRTRAARAHPTALMWGKQGVGSGHAGSKNVEHVKGSNTLGFQAHVVAAHHIPLRCLTLPSVCSSPRRFLGEHQFCPR